MDEGVAPEGNAPWQTAIRRLEARVAALEDRLRPLEAEAGPTRGAPAAPDPGADEAWSAGLWVGFPLAGRTLLALGGAFLIRAGTESGVVPPAGGVVVGLAYALFWLALGDRAAARGHRASANFHAGAALLIGYPLLWEATARFGYLSPAACVLGLSLLTFPALWLAWRRGTALAASMVTVAATACAFGLSFATRSAALFTLWLTTLGVVTLWIAYSRRWVVLPWLVAAATDVAALRVVLAGVAASTRGAALVGVSPGAAKTVAAALPIAYLGSIALRTLWKRRDVGPFEVLQSVLVLLLGVGGTAALARAHGDGTQVLGGGTLAAAVLAYLVAFLFVRRQLGRGSVFFFYGTTALFLAVAGGTFAGDAAVRTATWSLLGVIAASLGARFDRVSLRAHAAVYVLAAAVSSGLPAGAAAAIVHGSGAWPPSPWAAVALIGSTLAYAALAASPATRVAPSRGRIPRFVLATIAAAGWTGALAMLASRAIPAAESRAGLVEAFAARTFVLAAAAVALAWAARRSGLRETGWVAWLLLAAGAAKLILRDLQGGGSGSLFLAFACYGVALLVAPRLLRPSGEAEPTAAA